jgi:L,D-peptidoglycan transpeptidase YkuD (ErfK/YbiS/YcfS/YnhG family)
MGLAQSTARTSLVRSMALAFATATSLLVATTSASSATGSAARFHGNLASRKAILDVRSAACAPNLANDLARVGAATQLITVESTSFPTTEATLVAWHRIGRCWIRRFGPWSTRLGFAGFSNHKTEGDGTTPAGMFRIDDVMYGNAPNPGVHFSYHRIACGDWWDEDPNSPSYNRFVHLKCGVAPPFRGDSEALWRETSAYPIFAVVDYNTSPVIAGRGSAIFVHADVGGPTNGCVGLLLPELVELLRWLEPTAQPTVVMGPRSEIEHF